MIFRPFFIPAPTFSTPQKTFQRFNTPTFLCSAQTDRHCRTDNSRIVWATSFNNTQCRGEPVCSPFQYLCSPP